MSLLIFQVPALMILLIFAFFVSDFRNKEGMNALVNRKWILLIKILYAIPVLLYSDVLVTLENIQITDSIGLFSTLAATLMVVKAKKDMGQYHTWAGHKLNDTRMITRGIYSLIRHPLYTGIFVFMFGALIISVNHNPFNLFLSVIAVMIVAFLMVFLVMMAIRESRYLKEEFGEEYARYHAQVHAFVPISRYNFEE